MASTGLNEESVEKRFTSLTNTQDSIQGLSLWILHHKSHYARIVELWYRTLKKSVKPAHRLTLFYLCNDVVQTCKRKKALVFIEAFRTQLRQATALVRDADIRPKVERIFNIWDERQVFDKDFMIELRKILDGKQVEAVFKKPYSPTYKAKAKLKTKDKVQDKASTSDLEDMASMQPADPTLTSAKVEKKEKDADAPSEETLAAFKPSEMIEKIKVYKNQASEVENNVKKLSHLKLDASSIEAIKQLKDRAHGNEFSTQFEESCLRLEEAAEGLDKMKAEEKELLELLRISEYFYDQQHSEARIVANAYKTYGIRINTVKRKLDELIRTLPSPPVSPSPEALAPSEEEADLEHDDEPMDMSPSVITDGPTTVHGRDNDRSSPDSSPDDVAAPSPGNTSLETRLASILPALHSGSSSSSSLGEEHPIPVYIPQPLGSSSGTSGRRPSANKTLTESDAMFAEDDEGGSTPLTDEQPTTPVMDEEPVNSPSPPPPPPPPLPPPPEKKKENPIDFLSRLISQGQRTKPEGVGGESNSFFETFIRLTSRVKENTELKKTNPDIDNTASGGSPGPKSWAAWKAEKALEKGPVVEQPNLTIPPPLFPRFAIPPPVPPVPLAVPPPVLPSVPPSPVSPMGVVVSPVMAMPVPSPSLAAPTNPFFEHTSPGQKENWPQSGDGMGDSQDTIPSPSIDYPLVQGEGAFPSSSSKGVGSVKGILRTNNNSVLRELTPSTEETPVSEPPAAPPSVPPPSLTDLIPSSQHQAEEGSAITTLGSTTKSDVSEFVEKIRRRSSSDDTTPLYTPNPIRPNLMTLTPGGEPEIELDEDDEEEEEQEDVSSRIPVLSSIVRRVDPEEQRQTRQKDMQLFEDRSYDKYQHSYPADRHSSSSSDFSHRGHTFHKGRHYVEENVHNEYYVPSSFGYRGRSYPYESQQSDPYYVPYSGNFYQDGSYNPNASYPYGHPPPNGSFHKRGNRRGSSQHSYRY